jgi:hypothetical protein
LKNAEFEEVQWVNGIKKGKAIRFARIPKVNQQ